MITETDRDRAKAPGMELHQLERLIGDMEHEPNWRPTARKCADYYDHKQSTAQQLADAEETGERRVTINLIQRTINGALGQEAKTRLGWKSQPDAAVFDDVAAALGERMHEAAREAKADQAISEAYSSMLRTGIGWVEVKKSSDPLAYPYSVTALHRDLVWWDWRAKLPDRSDARWMLTQQWVDVDEAVSVLPQFRELIEMGCHTGPITDAMWRTINVSRELFDQVSEVRRKFSVAEEEWLDNSLRKRVRLYSVYYKAFKQVVALALGTRRVKFNPQNPLHQMAVQTGAARLIKGPSYEIRHAMFVGPYRLWDKPIPGRKFPLVPFVCYSCDDDYSPYGLVHGMIEPQDEFNERRTRLLWLIKAKQVFVDDDALATKYHNLLDAAKEAMRPDAFFVLNANRRNAEGLRIANNLQLQREQIDVMQDSKVLIQDVPGLYSPMFGSNSVGAESGVALNSLMEQTTTSLAETSDNYRHSRAAVGELLQDNIADDMAEPNLQMEIGTGKRRRTIVLNTFDERGFPVNHVEDASVRVALGDVPTTPAFKAQQQVFLGQTLQAVGNDPIARAVLVPAIIESGDLEHRQEYAKWLRQKYGVPDPGDMAGEAADQMEQAQQQQAAKQAQMAEAGALAEIEATKAKAAQSQTAAQLNQARVAEIGLRAQQAAQPPAANDEALIDDAIREARGA